MLADSELTGIVAEKPCAFMLLPSAPVAIVTGDLREAMGWAAEVVGPILYFRLALRCRVRLS
jgi:hypothetical protein